MRSHLQILNTRQGPLRLPAFFPDATYGAVRATSMDAALSARVQGMEMNTFHLYNRPGARLIKSLGGLHRFTGYDGVILTDSGGFQLYSMISENPSYGEIRRNEILFRPEAGAQKLVYTPEKCIQAQLQLGSDIMMALDLCTHPDDDIATQRAAVDATLRWGERCRVEYDKAMKGVPQEKRPLLFGIVQGGADRELRLQCGRELEAIGFDGYGFGGWPLGADGSMRYDVLQMAADAMPDGKLKYAMGLGRPEEIVRLHEIGYDLFDCVIPTREARHQRLYTFTPDMDNAKGVRQDGFYKFMYILDEKYCRDGAPVDASCDCPTCRRYPRAYLHHLFKMGDSAAYELATVHNLRFYSRLMEILGDGE